MPPSSGDYIGPGNWVYKDSAGNFRAGPKSKQYTQGQFVPESYAKAVRGSINFRNRVAGLVSNPNEETPDSYGEAQSVIAEFNRLDDELEKAESEERINELEREIDDLRADLGSP